MADVWLVLRGILFRRGVSLAVLVIAALVVGGAATGPLFLRAAGDSVLHDTVNQALPIGRMLSDHVAGSSASRPLARAERASLAKLTRLPLLDSLLEPPIGSLQIEAVVGPPRVTGQSASLVYRQGVCGHVRVVAGRCARAAGTVMISAATAAALDWHVGERLAADKRPVTVSGLYTPVDPTGDYWGDAQYFAAFSGSGAAGEMAGTLDAVFAPRSTLLAQPGYLQATGTVDRHLDVTRLRLVDVPVLQKQLLAYVGAGVAMEGGPADVTDTAVSSVLHQATGIAHDLVLPVSVVEAQLLVLAFLVLFLVVANAAEARGQEVALAKLRGAPAGSTVVFGLLDSVLLVLLAVPIGFGLAWAAVSAVAHSQLAPGTTVVLTTASVLAAAAAGAGAVIAAVLATWRMLRRPVVEQWRRATRRGRQRPWAIDVGLGLAAIAGLVVLARNGAVGSGRTTALALAVPGLLVLAAALLGSRVLPGLCRAAYGPTRRRGRIAGFLAVRQLGRRPSTLRLALILAVAFGLVTFGIDAWSVARGNQHDRAWTEVGAAEALTVFDPAGRDIGAIVDRLDPSGREAVAVTEATDYSGPTPVQLLAVQPRRFARVAFWRPDFGPGPLPGLAARLTRRVPPPVALSGDGLEVDVRVPRTLGHRPPLLVADVGQQGVGLNPVVLGPLRPGHHELGAGLPCVGGGCQLAGLHLERPGTSFYAIDGRLRVTGVRVRRHGTWHPVAAGAVRGRTWRAAGGGASVPGPHDAGLVLAVHASSVATPAWQVADRPVRLPALVTGAARQAAGTHVRGLSTDQVRLDPVALTTAIPGAGAYGVVVDRGYAQRAAYGANTFATDMVWVAPPAVSTFPKRLRRAGVSILATTTAAGQTAIYARQGPALAVLLFLAGAALGALLAAGGVVLTLHLAGRRRTYEMAAMAAFGVRRAVLFAALFAEQAILLAFGVAVGVAAGVVGAVVALPAVPEFADNPTSPPMLYGVHALPVLVTAGATVVVLGVVIALNAAALLRDSRNSQLREAPA